MTTQEFDEAVKDFSPEKEDLKEKLMNYLEKKREPYVFYTLLLNIRIAD